MRKHHFAPVGDQSESPKDILVMLFNVLCMMTAVIGNKGDEHQLAHKDRVKDFPVVMPTLGPHCGPQA